MSGFMMRAGRLDRSIRFERRSAAQEQKLGSYLYTWSELATVFANVQPVLPSRDERVADGIAIQARRVRVRTRYRADVDSDMRVIIGSDAYRIVGGPSEMGRREGLEMVCEIITTEGVEP